MYQLRRGDFSDASLEQLAADFLQIMEREKKRRDALYRLEGLTAKDPTTVTYRLEGWKTIARFVEKDGLVAIKVETSITEKAHKKHNLTGVKKWLTAGFLYIICPCMGACAAASDPEADKSGNKVRLYTEETVRDLAQKHGLSREGASLIL